MADWTPACHLWRIVTRVVKPDTMLHRKRLDGRPGHPTNPRNPVATHLVRSHQSNPVLIVNTKV